jgi:hypothetical protein
VKEDRMTAVADGLSVVVEEVGSKDPELMLTIGCSPWLFPLPVEELEGIRRSVAGRLGVSPEHFVELDFLFATTADRIQLLGLPVGEFVHLASRTHCSLITSVRQSIEGLGLELDHQAHGQTFLPTAGRNIPPPVIRRATPAYH